MPPSKKSLYLAGIFLLPAFLLSACSSSTVAADSSTIEPAASITLTLPEYSPTLLPSPATPTSTATPTPEAGFSRTLESDGMVQVYVPAGEFIMGADDMDAKKTFENGRAYPEVPVHTVYLEGYWFDKYEVTNRQYELCVDAGACQPPHLDSAGYQPSYIPKYFGNPDYANYPVIWVSWFYAEDYCRWAGRRLPTEAEWEKAGRGTDGRKYTWGNEPLSSLVANMCDVNCPLPHANGRYNDGFPDTAPVGSFPAGASPYGAMDMAGNVWEWTSSLIMDYPYSATDGREDLTLTGERSWRGASWTNGYWWMRVTLRYRSVDWYWNYNLGFRCASSA